MSFTDVDPTPNPVDPLYPATYVAVCALHGITRGTTPTTFDPYANITRFQLLSMVVRAVDEVRPGLLPAPPDTSCPPGTRASARNTGPTRLGPSTTGYWPG